MSQLETQSSPVAVEPNKKRRRRPRFIVFSIGVIVVLGAGLAVWQALFGGGKAATAAASQTKVVPVVKANREDLQTETTLQAEFVPYQDIAVHAKVSGYVNMIRVDIGDRVKQGDLLATLEIPELQDNIN